jgi:hypothetical protein
VGVFDGTNIVWGTADGFDNIVWGTLDDSNLVSATSASPNSFESTSWSGAF